jgi:hypothetical protein
MPRRKLYEPYDNSSDRVKLPLHLYGGGLVQQNQSVSISIGGRNGADVVSDFELRQMVEDEVTDLFLGLASSQVVLAEQFGFAGARLWCLVRTPRYVLLPDHREGKPGDFDIIVGSILDDDYVDLSILGLVECKVGKAPPTCDSSRTELPKFATSRGTTQARAAVELGFDFVSLAHFLVRDASDESPALWSSAADAANFRVETERLQGSLLKDDDDPPFGIISIGMGQVRGADPHLSGAISPTIVHRAPRLERRGHSLRREIEANIRTRIPKNMPAAPFFHFCQRCSQLFGTADARSYHCGDC